MIFKGIEFYNVSSLLFDTDSNAYSLLRLPIECETNMLEQGRNMNRSSIGVELRFALVDDEIEIILKGKNEAGMCFVYFGDVQAEWFQSSFVIKNNEDTIIKIKKTNLDVDEINKNKGSIYPSNMVRILFNGTMVQFADIKGKVEPIEFERKTMLFYGSSITANSITFTPGISYPTLVCKDLGIDLKNVGFPGSCRIEKEVVDEISSFDFDMAFIELGINIINDIEVDEYKEKCSYLLSQITKKKINIFMTDIYSYYNERCGVSDDKLSSFRDTLKSLCLGYGNVIYIPGNSLLPTRSHLCADLVHPDIDGHRIIYSNLIKEIRKHV